MEILHTYKLPVPAWEGQLRKCSKCERTDSPVYAGESDEEGKPIFDHQVVVDLVFLFKRITLTRAELSQGWALMQVDGRASKVRMMCRECLGLEQETEEVWRDYNTQKQREQSKTAGDSWWFQICMED